MKQFFKAVFTHLFALALFSGGLLVLGLFTLALLAAAGGSKPRAIENRSILSYDMGLNIVDTPPSFDPGAVFSALTGDAPPRSISLRAVVRAIRAAKADPRISGLHLHGNVSGAHYGSGFAALKEVREAILDFKRSGKPVSAYLLYADNKDLYLASAADKLLLHPRGEISAAGLSFSSAFFKGLFEKYGVGVDVLRVGRYKSAVEPFTREGFSPEEREQTSLLLRAVWGEVRGAIAESRGLDAAQLQKWVDEGRVFDPAFALENGLVTALATEEESLAQLRVTAGKEKDADEFPQVGLSAYVRTLPSAPAGDCVAVVYAEGEIGLGQSEPGHLGADSLVDTLREVARNDSVKAVVLRVNSPGGSVLASDLILDEVRRLRQTRPVVVSMGSLAASGGYWISTASNRIFAEETTITGSIGVFGLLLNVKDLAASHGITFDAVKTGRMADAGSIARPLTTEEKAVLQRSVERVYDDFVSMVAQSRGMPEDAVREIAQGRVWSGYDARRIGLVDEIGGLDAAVAHAAKLAGLAEGCAVEEFPHPKRLEEVLEELLSPAQDRLEARLAARRDPLLSIRRRAEEALSPLQAWGDPRGLYARMPYTFDLR